jgi:membrane-associated phospholipid phosphatase
VISMPLVALVLVSLVAGVSGSYVVSRAPFRALATDTPNGFAAIAALKASARRDGIKAWVAATRHRTSAACLALCAGLSVFVVGWVCVGVLAWLVRENSSLLRIDTAAARWSYDSASQLSLGIINLVTLLGDTLVVAGLALVLVIVEWLRGRDGFVALFVGTVVIGNAAITVGAKLLMHRARPTFNPIAYTLGPSFPSGHSSMAASFFAAAAFLLSQRHSRSTTAALGGAAVTIAVAVAASRVLLDVHWLSDVIAGLAVGWAWFAFCVLAFDGSLRVVPSEANG